MKQKHEYTVVTAGWIAGTWRASGSTVELTERQARYENVVIIGVDLSSRPDETVVHEVPLKPKGKRKSRKK